MVAGGVKFGLHEPTSTGQEAKVGQERLYFRVTDLPLGKDLELKDCVGTSGSLAEALFRYTIPRIMLSRGMRKLVDDG